MTNNSTEQILVIPLDKLNGISHLLDIVANDGNQGKKTEKYWLISTQATFQPTGNMDVEFYNQLLHHSQIRGFSYLQIMF